MTTDQCCPWCRNGSMQTERGCDCFCHDKLTPLHYIKPRWAHGPQRGDAAGDAA